MREDTVNLKYKVVVVGGGVAGLYCAYRLKQAHTSVGLFEGTARWGGRVETQRMGKGKFKAEFGPMRFERSDAPGSGQVKLMKLLDDLGVSTSRFPAYQSMPVKHPAYHITDSEEERWPNPLDLLLMGVLKALGAYEPGMTCGSMRKKVGEYGESRYDELRRTARQGGDPKGEFLHQRGFWNVLADVLSHQAVLKIRDTGNFYHMIHENPNAIEWIIFWLRAFQPQDYLVGIKGGSDRLTKTLVESLDKDHCRQNHWLRAITQAPGEVLLEFEVREAGKAPSVVKVSAEHVILALPKRPLEHLAQFLPPEVRRDLDAARGIPLLKCFFVVTKPWWNEDTKPHTNAGHMPTREVHYYQEHSLQLDEKHRTDLLAGEVTASLRADFAAKGITLPPSVTLSRRQDEKKKLKGWWLQSHAHHFFIALEDLSVFDRKGKGMVMVYTDRPATEYWNQFVVDRSKHAEAEMRKNGEQFKRRVIKYLSAQLRAQLADAGTDVGAPECLQPFVGLDDEAIERAILPQIEDWGIHDWEHEPFGGAFHVWRPGVRSWEVMARMKAFGAEERLHIVGEAFSDYHGFIEGCLNSADLALETIPAGAATGTPAL